MAAQNTQDACHAAFAIDSVLENIMGCLEIWDRLESAALVCQHWQRAAAHVTTVDINRWFDGSIDEAGGSKEAKLVHWLNEYGSKVSSMVIHDGALLRGKPKPFLSMLTNVTNLGFCCMGGSTEAWSCMAQSLKNLRTLSFRHMTLVVFEEVSTEATAWQQLWATCSLLTYIKIEQSHPHDDCLLGITQLKHLDTLELPDNNIKGVGCLTPLPVNLRALNLKNNPQRYSRNPPPRLDIIPAVIGRHPEPGVSAPRTPAANLEMLDISGLALSEPSVLSGLTSLTALHAGGLNCPQPRDILAVVPHMPKLRSLDISWCFTHSFGLQGPSSPRHGGPDDTPLRNPALGTADIMQLVSACPGLQDLSIAIASMPASTSRRHAHWSFDSDDAGEDPTANDHPHEPCSLLPLQHLFHLTALTLWGCYKLQDEHLSQLAALTQLHSLDIYAAGHITDKGLQSLTQLSALTELFVKGFDGYGGVSKEVVPSDESNALFLSQNHWLKDEHGQPSTVCQELAARCARSPLLHPVKSSATRIRAAQIHSPSVARAMRARLMMLTVSHLRCPGWFHGNRAYLYIKDKC